ncbi:MAG: GNAT family N-acetyltransferase [Candidatus Hydrogenedentes bacterium]|nr:GNAT family N-acetyltransferase [Candidatus Hydrogenedentota bacterium]
MIHDFGSVTLKSGETVEVGCVQGPELAWAERIEKLLGHKGDVWRAQNSEILRNDVGIEAYFYILHRDGVPFSNIMTVEVNGVGILGHVWTDPEDRRKNATTLLMERQMAHFRERGGKALFLGTGFDSPPYHIYERFGFRGIEDHSGSMDYYASSKSIFEGWYFAPGPAELEPLSWKHWPASPALFLGAFPGVVRSAPMKLIGRRSTEGRLLPLLRELADGKPARAVALRSRETTAVLGMAVWDWDPLWRDACLVDVYCHPDHWSRADELLAALELPQAARYVAYTDPECAMKCELFRRAGFRSVVTLPQWTPGDSANTHRVDVTLLEKAGAVTT